MDFNINDIDLNKAEAEVRIGRAVRDFFDSVVDGLIWYNEDKEHSIESHCKYSLNNNVYDIELSLIVKKEN